MRPECMIRRLWFVLMTEEDGKVLLLSRVFCGHVSVEGQGEEQRGGERGGQAGIWIF